mgnify:CR=1 FL=1
MIPSKPFHLPIYGAAPPVTITDAAGRREVVTADEFRRRRGLVRCPTCQVWDVPENFTTRRRRRFGEGSKSHACQRIRDPLWEEH